ncbi:MAG: oligosaccharide flippase family protein [Pseudomonadota bacterium]|nr:oligosaccharide flippase family protein [Pseudomonadota bacterium]
MFHKNIIERFAKNVFFRNVITLMSGTALAQVIPVLLSPVLTRLYSPEQYGTLALFTSVVGIFSVAATFRYELSIMLPEQDSDAVNIIVLSLILNFSLSTILLIITFLFDKQLTELLNNPLISRWLYFVPLMVFLIGVFQSMHYWLSRKNHYNQLSAALISRSGIKGGAQVGAVYAVPGIGTTGLIGGAIFGQFVATIIIVKQSFSQIFRAFKKVSFKRITELGKKYKTVPLINTPHSLVNDLSSNLPVMLLTSFFTSKVAVLYSLALMAVMLPTGLVSNAIGQVFYQRISDAYNKKESLYPYTVRLVKGLFFVSIIPFGLLFFLAPSLFGLIFGGQWTEAGLYTRILTPWILMRFVVAPMSYVPLVLSQQGKAFRIEVAGIIFVVIALVVGGMLENVTLTLSLLSCFSLLVLVYSFSWIISISKNAKIEA